MNTQSESPLISVALMTYNQEKYVKESLLSMLNQTYDNLEIIVSDDCSKDGTWNVIESEVDRYRRVSGKHKNVVLNRNQRNLGIARHFDLILSKCHGELVVCQAGDDISMPQRVARIVEEWVKDNKQALAIYHGALKYDAKGHYMGELGDNYFTDGTLGAVAAYSLELATVFGPVSEDDAAEDEVYGNRALMLDRRLNIRENLLKYRINVGVSSGFRDYRRKQIRVLREFELAAMRQAFIDLEKVRMLISSKRYCELKRKFTDKLVGIRLWLDLWDSPSISNRFSSYKKVLGNCSNIRLLIATILLLPRRIGDLLLFVLNYLGEMANRAVWCVKRGLYRE